MILRRRTKHSTRGQALVEFALILPIFLLLIFGIIDLGRFVMTDHILSQAAREAARQAAVEASWVGSASTSCGKVEGPVCPADATALHADALAAANRMVAGLGGSISDLNISCDAPGNEPSGPLDGRLMQHQDARQRGLGPGCLPVSTDHAGHRRAHRQCGSAWRRNHGHQLRGH